MEDLIYVLIALLWIVFSVVMARQKQAAKPVDEDQPRPRTSWEQMLEELLPPETNEEEEYPTEAPVYEAPRSAEVIPAEQHTSPFEAYNTIDFQAESLIPEIVSLEDLNSEDSLLSKQSVAAAFGHSSSHQYNPVLLAELRRAIVYNAVLERPAW